MPCWWTPQLVSISCTTEHFHHRALSPHSPTTTTHSGIFTGAVRTVAKLITGRSGLQNRKIRHAVPHFALSPHKTHTGRIFQQREPNSFPKLPNSMRCRHDIGLSMRPQLLNQFHSLPCHLTVHISATLDSPAILLPFIRVRPHAFQKHFFLRIIIPFLIQQPRVLRRTSQKETGTAQLIHCALSLLHFLFLLQWWARCGRTALASSLGTAHAITG